MKRMGSLILVTAAILTGCASAGPPVAVAEVTEAETAIRRAEEAGADQRAPELLNEARDAMDAARRVSGEEARQRLLEARGYAAAAEARARSERLQREAARLRREADDLERRADEIRDEAGNPPPGL
jgi:predicted ArsR family transcriptional regulator